MEDRIQEKVAPRPPRDFGLDVLAELAASDPTVISTMDRRVRELEELCRLTTSISEGLLLDEVLERVYGSFDDLIPYDRIGFALIEGDRVVARWAKSNLGALKLKGGYSLRLDETSLGTIIETERPRIINDLAEYLDAKPSSASTRLVVSEGLRSSLTCPLISDGTPIGFMFFSSAKPGTYTGVHVATFMRIAAQLAVVVERGRMASELEARRAAMEQANEELRHLDDMKDRFLGMAAHDLRNPSSSILMAAEYLQSVAGSDEQRMFAKDIHEQARYMLALINDLLDVSQIESGALELNPVPVVLQDFVGDEVARHATLAAPKGTTILFSAEVEGRVDADPVRLRQVLDNLLSNAVKYAPPRSTVRVRLKEDGAGFRVEVQDEGPGISPADQRRLFRYFGRLSAKPTGGESSTGLGMAITRRIVEAHGGEIGVDSVLGAGSTFWFRLPA